MSKIGPFFYIKNNLIYNSCSLKDGRRQANKIDNSYSHEQLFDKHFKSGDYINFPRGRVVWDDEKKHSIIYIDRCINRSEVISKIIAEFDIENYVTELDDHYRCKNCIGDLFDELKSEIKTIFESKPIKKFCNSQITLKAVCQTGKIMQALKDDNIEVLY